ncbi:MAG: hypothetical protein NC489_35870 [Ruminococcus flavefaciens]|nr:hypothetical protein [Ruminococcus flavefaciens]
MNWKKLGIYSLSVLMTLYQMGNCMPMEVLAASVDSVVFIRNQADGVYQAEKRYEEWMKEYPNCIHGADEWKKVDGKYQYPVTPYDKEWGTYFSEAERHTACQIPQEILMKLTTEELLELVLDSPIILDMYVHDSIVEAVKGLAQDFNGVHELLSREDCLAVVSHYYTNYDIPEKQQLDYDKLLGDSDTPNYDIIVDNDALLKKAGEDAKVMHTLNLCEAIIEIAFDSKKLSVREEQTLTEIILQKSKEKLKSECVEGISTETDQADSIFNRFENKFSLSKNSTQAKNSTFTWLDRTITYSDSGSSARIPDAIISEMEGCFKEYQLVGGGKAVKMAGKGGTYRYNCFNYAWLKKYDPANLWRKCIIDLDSEFVRSEKLRHANKPGGYGWVGSGKGHAVYAINEEVQYRDSRGYVLSAPLVYSKWGATGPLMCHPVTLGKYDITRTDDIQWYC